MSLAAPSVLFLGRKSVCQLERAERCVHRRLIDTQLTMTPDLRHAR
jgi:hypothetical protein